ncbi:hypothetical protein CONPUDRAFT_119192 [Coniophora puteana RWD-64-598 SS2]|uniref:BRCT domain-containing protein n=1 Tax=Coniophora puteana (strain RWD-64-598) TaxID=741705 RepID=A0A5M3MXI1_CONPW|nr:uncharacterized protein CONPUDRAFT_119192 [Coniophora puteana RWD-64-598 SS2]EIW83796.1 hypothetical protein CONPUDRAFT_119192 [Coniophora puteana RWD-64-598 SS2]
MRRGNKSHKVPNVKLRPAQPAPKHATARPGPDMEPSSDTEFSAPAASMVDLCPRPFTGFTLCATGNMDKATVFKQAFELGASSTPDFTDRVTHLIASSHGGAKYTCALERKIPIMSPEWIAEAHAIWLRGDDVDVEQVTRGHRLPVFSDCVVCVTGIDDISRRTEINALVTRCGGTYVKAIERPVRVTHLLCGDDFNDGEEGGRGDDGRTDKMRYAEKFNLRGEANIHIIWEEWVWDCVEFGGRFDERRYSVSRTAKPKERRTCEEPTMSYPVEDTAPPGTNPTAGGASSRHGSRTISRQPTRRISGEGVTTANSKHSNGADEEEDEPASKREPSHPAARLQLWEQLLKPRGFVMDGGQLIKSPERSQPSRRAIDGQDPPASDEDMPSTLSKPAKKRPVQRRATLREPVQSKDAHGATSVLAGLRRADSFAPESAGGAPGAARRMPFGRAATVTSVAGDRPGPADAEGSRMAEGRMELDERPGVIVEEPEPVEGGGGGGAPKALFVGRRFRLLGEASTPAVRSAIQSHGGVVLEDKRVEVDYIVVRLTSGKKLYDLAPPSLRHKFRTECWLEHSVFLERICEPHENLSFQPIQVECPVKGSESVDVSLSGLDQAELCWVRRLMRVLGISLGQTFSRRTTHLVCPSANGAKYDKALEWNIPVVNLSWLEDAARLGTVPHNLEAYSVQPAGEMAIVADKGKAKVSVNEDVQMVDITNNNEPQHVSMPRKKPPLRPGRVPTLPSIDADIPTAARFPNAQSAGSSFFGQPKGLLAPPSQASPTPAHEAAGALAPLPRHNSASSSLEYLPVPLPHAPRASGRLPPSDFPSSSPPPVPASDDADADLLGAPSSPPTELGGLEDMPPPSSPPAPERVPSSRSPSPMKLPSQVRARIQRGGKGDARMLSASPQKDNIRATRDGEADMLALKESITSMLGKRQGSMLSMTDDEDELNLGYGPATGQGAGAGGRRGKRVRPSTTRSKLASRQVSKETFGGAPVQSVQAHVDPEAYAEMMGVQSTEESMRVTYEDPRQHEERLRIMNLLGGGDADAASGGGGESSKSESQMSTRSRTKRGAARG